MAVLGGPRRYLPRYCRPDGSIVTHKLLSEFKHYRDAALQGIRVLLGLEAGEPIAADGIDSVKCGTTVATNALLERKGHRIAAADHQGLRRTPRASAIRTGPGRPAIVLSKRYPAAVIAGNTAARQLMCNTLFGALCVIAGSQATMNNHAWGSQKLQNYETVCGGTGRTGLRRPLGHPDSHDEYARTNLRCWSSAFPSAWKITRSAAAREVVAATGAATVSPGGFATWKG